MTFYDTPDHPVIRNMERTGYPGKVPPVLHCDDCDQELSFYDTVYAKDGGIYCKDCMIERIAEELDTDKAARNLGYTPTRVSAFLDQK